MRMDQNTLKNAVMLIIVLGVLLAGFFVLFEKGEKKVTTPGSPEARKNPFLAAERFLGASGIPAQSIEERSILINLPPTDALIFINRLGGNLPREREDGLIQWIEKGGTLVITHDKLWREKFEKSGNTLLDRLGVRKFDACEMKTDAASGDDAGAPGLGKNKETVRVPMGKDAVAEIRFTARYILEDASAAASQGYGGKTGDHIVSRDMGRGKLIILSDNAFLRNANIGSKDHAFYLAGLAAGRARVWILFNSVMPSFFSLLLRHAPFFFFSLLLFALVTMLWLTLGIGPRYKIRDHASRNITQHLLSAGHFMRRHDPGKALINETRSAIEAKMAKSVRFWKQQSKQQRCALIAEWARLSQADVEFAFTADVERPAAFVRATAILQKINHAISIEKKRGSP